MKLDEISDPSDINIRREKGDRVLNVDPADLPHKGADLRSEKRDGKWCLIVRFPDGSEVVIATQP